MLYCFAAGDQQLSPIRFLAYRATHQQHCDFNEQKFCSARN